MSARDRDLAGETAGKKPDPEAVAAVLVAEEQPVDAAVIAAVDNAGWRGMAPGGAISRRQRRALSNRRAIIPGIILVFVALTAIFGPFIVQYDPFDVNPRERLLPPGTVLSDGSRAWLGTDGLGRDMVVLLVEGARVSLLVGVATIAVAGTIGSIIGMIAGYQRGMFDTIFMRLADIQLAFPSLLLAIFIAGFLGPSLPNVIFTLALSRWVLFARVARAQTLAVRQREFVESSVALGANSFQLLRRCIIPACVSPLLVVATLELGLVIISEASLSFLGLGSPVTMPSWGATIAVGRDFLDRAWWIATMPGVILSLVIVCVGIIGDQLRDRLDPYMRAASRI
jgi:peptide/nickel transport system permease protein